MDQLKFAQFLFLFFSLGAFAKMDLIYEKGYLGEKDLSGYSERYQPLIFQDIYTGKMTFEDDLFFQNYFQSYGFERETDFSNFFRSELSSGMICSNELLAKHYNDIQYSYRLITLSYLLEGEWHLKTLSDHFRLKNGCNFDLNSWVKSCKPKSPEMKKFLSRLEQYSPKYEENFPADYKKEGWLKELKTGNFKWYSHYRMKNCSNCSETNLQDEVKKVCDQNREVMNLICSEEDSIYGLSDQRDAYSLLGRSNIINTYNKSGEAMGCLRRFSEVFAHKEADYEALKNLFPALQTFLQSKYQERFLQGRVFFYGSGKEFEDKGLSNLYVKEQPLQVAKVDKEPAPVVASKTEVKESKPELKPEPQVVLEPPKKEPIKEISKPLKSAFLLAAEVRESGNLDVVEVDMLKLKYDYTFSLNMINTLSERLKTFMTREALKEMMIYDKLGSKEGPVPLFFIKYMIDMQEHHGLYNIISTLGDKFYVSNEIDASFNPKPELVQVKNDDSTGKQWQIYIIRP